MCGIFGCFDYSNQCYNLVPILKELGENSFPRGQDATGLSTVNKKGEIEIVKSPINSLEFKYEGIYSESNIYIGHVRMATCGKPELNFNNHPFISKRRSFALAHNGILRDVEKTKFELDITSNKIETDTYLAVQILDFYPNVTLKSMKFLCESIKGEYLFTVLNKNKELFIAKKDNPITIYDFYKMGLLIYASTKDILNDSVDRFEELHNAKKKGEFKAIKVKDGEILKLRSKGNKIIVDRKEFVLPKKEKVELIDWSKIEEYPEDYKLCEGCKDLNCEACYIFQEMYSSESKYDLSKDKYMWE